MKEWIADNLVRVLQYIIAISALAVAAAAGTLFRNHHYVLSSLLSAFVLAYAGLFIVAHFQSKQYG